MISTLNIEIDPEAVSLDPVLKADPKALFSCPGNPSVVFPDLPRAYKNSMALENEEGVPLPSTVLCDSKKLRLVYSRFVVDLWLLAADPRKEVQFFIEDVRRLNGRKIRIRLHSQPKKIALLTESTYEPAWFSPEEKVIHIGPRVEGGGLPDALVRRHYRGYFFNELSHLWVFSLMKDYPAYSSWHDFSSAGPAPAFTTFNILWSKNPYAIQTPQTAAVFEAFSNVIEKLGFPFTFQHPFADENSSLKLYFDSERKNFYFAYDPRFEIPLEKLLHNEAYLTTTLYILISRLQTTGDLKTGYADLGLNHSPTVSAPNAGVILNLASALRDLVKDNSFEKQPQPLFFQWLRAYDRVAKAQGDSSKPGARLAREFFFYDIDTDTDIGSLLTKPVRKGSSVRIYLKDPASAPLFYTPTADRDARKFNESVHLQWAKNTPNERLLKIIDSHFRSFEKNYSAWNEAVAKMEKNSALYARKVQKYGHGDRRRVIEDEAMNSKKVGAACGSLETVTIVLNAIERHESLRSSFHEIMETRDQLISFREKLLYLKGDELDLLKVDLIRFLFSEGDLLLSESILCGATNVLTALERLK